MRDNCIGSYSSLCSIALIDLLNQFETSCNMDSNTSDSSDDQGEMNLMEKQNVNISKTHVSFEANIKQEK